MQDLINKARAALVFLRQNTEAGKVVLDIENCPGVISMMIEISGDWFSVTVYQSDGLRYDRKSQQVYDALARVK